jgi:hypothetical protein
MSISLSSARQNRPVRVGFDLDGVLLYNPTRNFRPIITFVKKYILRRKKTTFLIPKSRWQQVIFIWLHRTSLWIAPGVDEIKALKTAGIIEPYLITARFSFLNEDLASWLKKLEAEKVFVEICANTKDEQPFTFKASQIKRLKLEMFVEDNWDIVMKLETLIKANQPDFVCWWVSNTLDWRINYAYKVNSLAEAVRKIRQVLTKK